MVTALIVLCIWAQADQEREVECEIVETESEKGVRRWHKMTVIVYPQIIMIFSAPRPYLQMRDAEVQIVGDRFVCNVSWKYWGFILTICLLGFILLYCFHLKVLFWPCQLQLLSLSNIEYFLFLNGPFFYSIEYSPLTWDCRRPFGPRMEDWPLLMLIAFFALSRCPVAHPLCQNISHASQHSS